jgi:hypothetical protein
VRRGEVTLFNFEVEGDHTYFVGENALLVHNAAPACNLANPKVGGEVSWKNGWRTADGKFANPLTAGRSGALGEQGVWDAVKQKPGWNVVEGRVSVRDAAGNLRVYDGAAISPRGRVIGLEVKSGTARRSASQRAFDRWLNSSPGNLALGVGKTGRGLTVQRVLKIQVP